MASDMNSERPNWHPVPCHARVEPLNTFGIVSPRQFNSIVAEAALEGGFQMDTTTLLIIVLLILLLGGGGWYGRGRWY